MNKKKKVIISGVNTLIIVTLIIIITQAYATGYLSPDTTGDPTSQWTNPNNVKVSDNSRAEEDTVFQVMDTSDYNIENQGIPANAVNISFEVIVEGNSGACII